MCLAARVTTPRSSPSRSHRIDPPVSQTIRISDQKSDTERQADEAVVNRALNGNFSTMIVSGSASREEIQRAKSAMQKHDAVLELCPQCGALLDVSGCSPLTETTCPSCSALIKVLREFHHFVLLSQLGRGGGGTVYRAFDETLERDVALKLLRNERTSDPEYIQALEREAVLTASINHPHVVKVYSTGHKNGFYYIAMEVVAGGSLAEQIKRQVRLPEEFVLSAGIQIAEGLLAACLRGLLHRDLKPGNILLADKETMKVADFGLALPIEQATEYSGDIWGTPDYIAPEKLLRQGEDIRSDIYSLGCTFFHCLAGFPPLDTTTVMAMIKTQKVPPAPNIQELAPDVSEVTASIIRRCLEPNPADRFQDYGEVIEHLKYAQSNAAPPAARSTERPRPAPRAEAVHSLPSRRRVPASFIASATLLLIVLVVGGSVIFRQKPQTIPSRKPVEAAPPPAVAPPPSAKAFLNGNVALGSSNAYDLTALGVVDWAHWTGKYVHKASGGEQISDISWIDDADHGSFAATTNARHVRWSDGTPVAASSDDQTYMWCKNKQGAGLVFTVHADTTARTLNVLCGGTPGTSITVTAHLSDGSAPDFSNTQLISSPNLNLATLEYCASSADQTLTVSIVLTTPKTDGTGSVDLAAAWLE